MDTALESIRLLPEQITQVVTETAQLDLPVRLSEAKLLAIAGMGGSIYNYHVITALLSDSLKVPVIKVNNYGLPAYLDQTALVIGSSYSGSTEEVLYNVQQAVDRQIPVMAYSAGGALQKLAESNHLPFFKFNPTNNPSGQPRMGQGYMLFGAIGILSKLGFLKETFTTEFLTDIKKRTSAIAAEAKELAGKLKDAELFYIAADHLAGNAHIIRNQTNETAKLYADYNLVPELNHHLMEGLKHPQGVRRIFVLFDSVLYQKRNHDRLLLTEEVIAKNGYTTYVYTPQSTSKMGQFVETLIWGGYLTYELGKLYQEDPNLIPWVDYFKKKLGQMT